MANICYIIKEKRKAGRIVCEVFHGSQIISRKLQLKRLGYNDIPESLWVEANRTQAVKLLTDCLAFDLAYRIRIMSDIEAKELADVFLNCFDADTKFLTNTTQFVDEAEYQRTWSWEPISHATIDTGIIAIKEGVEGILWFEDED